MQLRILVQRDNKLPNGKRKRKTYSLWGRLESLAIW